MCCVWQKGMAYLHMKKIELPLADPIFSTFNSQSAGTIAITDNPSIRNWYLNNSIILSCNSKFLSGFSSPEVKLCQSGYRNNPHLERQYYGMQFSKKYLHDMIREMLENHYYVYFTGVDDFYVEGKSWFQERHNSHDGIIYGHDPENKTYQIYAYDRRWIARGFSASMRSFEAGCQAMHDQGVYGKMCAIKPLQQQISFNLKEVCKNLKNYLDTGFAPFARSENAMYFGIEVYDYVKTYIRKLYDGSIPYERMDRRVFRLLWEHEKAMWERMQKAEGLFQLGPEFSLPYTSIVDETNRMRMLYASHNLKRRDSVLPVIEKKLQQVKETESSLLPCFIEKMEGLMTK